MSHIDPVCRMEIEEEDSVGTVVHDGVTYHFCADVCVERFREHPELYLGAEPHEAAPLPL